MIDTIVYFSHPGSNNTYRFVSKMKGFTCIRIPLSMSDDFPIVDKPYCLVTPTYKGGDQVAGHSLDAVPKQVVKFLDTSNNAQNAQCVVVGGNRNFVEDFCIAGDQIHNVYGIAYKYRFELSGNERDVEILQENLKNINP